METNLESTNIDVEEVTKDKLVSDLKTVAHDAEELLKATATDLGEKAKEARARLMIALERFRANYQNFQGKAAEGAKVTDKIIREHPYESVGIAFGMGLLLGILINRK